MDWRTLKDNMGIKACSIPDHIASKCVRYVSELGLVFGAIDLVRSDDEYYFLEINPNGEWGWLQKNPGLPIAESITDRLIEGVKDE